MKKAYIKRDYKKEATYGVFFFDDDKGGVVSLASLELPWKDNANGVSCIPSGKYKVKKTYSPRFKKQMWEVLNVVDRAGIRLHPVNYVRDLEGCIGLGLAIEDINHDGIFDISSSKTAFAIADKYLGDEFELTIS